MRSTTAFEADWTSNSEHTMPGPRMGDDQACSGIWQCQSRKPQCPLEFLLQTQTPWPSSGATASGTAAPV